MSMPAIKVEQTPASISTPLFAGLWPVLAVVCAITLLQLLTNRRYGFFIDELQFMSDGRHLDWGFVAYPPFTPFLARVSMSLFGVSLGGLRLFSALAEAAILFLTALMARELGAGKLGQAAAALGIGLSLHSVYDGRVFWYTSFDYLWWVLAAYFAVRLLKSENPRWWLAIGAAEGLGLLTKYTMVYFIAGILLGAMLTHPRRYLASGWFWAGNALALLIFLPNILWELRHDFVTYSFLEFIHARDIGEGRTDKFLIGQLIYCLNPFAAPLTLAGLIGYMRSRRYRMIGWMYIVPLALILITSGRSYYLAPAYPMLMAMGCQMGERWIALPAKISAPAKKAPQRAKAGSRWPWRWSARQWAGAALFTGVILWGAWVCAVILPFQSRGLLRDYAFRNNGNLKNEFGWNDLVRTVAGIRDSLPPDQQAHVGILVGNYAEQGAVEILGSAYGLPPAISTINSGGLRGYPSPAPTTLIVVGFSDDMASALFSDCRLAGHNGNSEGILNFESATPDIFLCGAPRQPWPDLWKNATHFE
jgi:hypothetical protein